jgi:hypothetical protein
MSGRSGEIITFYSYKGGTGRTMALSNVAWILASNGCKVLLIDWDLEAPGLHRYLRPFLVDPELTSTPGLIDFVWDTARVIMTPRQGDRTSKAKPSKAKYPALEDYVVGLDWSFRGDGSIAFLPAGRQDENYAQRVNTFSWDNFYDRLGGGKLLEAERTTLRKNYDYVLIDSRTGVSDTSSICTVHMPDALVVLFTLNRQSIRGAAAVAASVRAQRGERFPIFPIPTRVEKQESTRVEAAIAYGRRAFAPFLHHVQSNPLTTQPDQQVPYWNEVETPYQTFYALEEIPAAFKDEPGSYGSVLAANEHIARWITDRAVLSLRPESEERRKQVIDAYALKEDEIGGVDWLSQAGKVSLLRRLARLLPRRRRAWRYATIIVAVAASLLALGLGLTLKELGDTKAQLASTKAQLESERNSKAQSR